METYAVPLGALIVSLATLIFTGLSLRGKAQEAHVESVDRRLADARDEFDRRLGEADRRLAECERARDEFYRIIGQLKDDNLRLLQKLTRNGG